MSSKLYNQIVYNSPIPFLISQFIREYDIEKANINILYKYKVITKEQYDYLYKCPRMERQITIGNLERKNKEITEIKKKGITEAKKLFFESNDISDNEVLSIKNDAIFLINKVATITRFDNINFVNKNVYTSFYRLNNNKIEAYYLYDRIKDIEKIDIKGISKEKVDLHREFFIDFLLTVFQTSELESIEDTIKLISSFNQIYLNLDLDVEYYRNFDEMSKYMIAMKNRNYYLDTIKRTNLKDINIICNLNIIRELWSYICSIKFKYR